MRSWLYPGGSKSAAMQRVARHARDGWITELWNLSKVLLARGIRSSIDATWVKSVAAAPGIFYVFRSESAEQKLLARHARGEARSRLGIAELIYRQHPDLLDFLATWIEQNRRIPTAGEIGRSQELIDSFGSIRAAFAVIRRVTDNTRWVGVNTASRRTSESIFEANLDMLQPLIDFLTERGRLPHDAELEQLSLIEERFGSARKAYSLIRRVTGNERWSDLNPGPGAISWYISLSAFGGRPRYSELPPDLQHDARDLFGSYKEAIAQADRLLFAVGNQEAIDIACRSASFGKLTPEALYVHVDGLSELPAILRVYTGCAETLTGRVNDATILKMHRLKPQVSFLVYPEFDRLPHPILRASIVSRIRERSVELQGLRSQREPAALTSKGKLCT